MGQVVGDSCINLNPCDSNPIVSQEESLHLFVGSSSFPIFPLGVAYDLHSSFGYNKRLNSVSKNVDFGGC